MNRYLNIWLLSLLACSSFAENPIEKWKQFPKQHLVTNESPAHTQTPTPITPVAKTFEYEDLIVFSLRATIAAFHFEPKTFGHDQQRLSQYFEPSALSQIEQSLYAASGSGLMDQYIITQKPCNAITRSPAIVEKKAAHYAQIRLPMVLSDKRTVDVVLSLKIEDKLIISDFSIEEPKEQL